MWEICAFSMHSLHHLLPPLRKCNNLRGHKTVATHMSFLSIPEIFTKRHLLFKHCIWIYYFIYIWFCFLSFTVLLIFICCNGCIDVHLTRLINITYVLISLTLNLLVSGHEPCNIGVIGQTVSGSQWVMGNHLWPTACSGCRRSAAAAGGNETNRRYVRRQLYSRSESNDHVQRRRQTERITGRFKTTQLKTRKCTLWRCKSTPTPKAKLLWMTSHYGPTVVRSVTEIPFHVFIW